MSTESCEHRNIREFKRLRRCLACGEAVLEASVERPRKQQQPAYEAKIEQKTHLKNINFDYTLGQQIRICELLLGEPDDDILCELVYVNLEDDPAYDAVSYTWATERGDAQLSSSVKCIDGGTIPITKNCAIVLRQLRSNNAWLRLWVDAICINQTNIHERNHQVAMMDSVYSKARCVRVCIWDRTISAGYMGYEALFEWLRNGPDGDNDHRHVLYRLFLLRYFKRVWVIQEVALANTIFLHLNRQQILVTHSVLLRMQSLVGSALPAAFRLRTGEQLGSDSISCLRAAFECGCADERDKVFAVRSLMSSLPKRLLKVDYSQTTATIYATALIATILDSRNLNILKYTSKFRPFPGDKSEYTCPVFDFDDFKRYLNAQSSDPNYNEAGNSPIIAQSSCLLPHKGREIWQREIDPHVLQYTDEGDDSYLHEEPYRMYRVLIFQEQYTRLDTCIIPRLRVRSHFIDRIKSTPLQLDYPYADRGSSAEPKPKPGRKVNPMTVPYAQKVANDIEHKFTRLLVHPISAILPFFYTEGGGNQAIVCYESRHGDELFQHDYPNVNLPDILLFIEHMAASGDQKVVFTTENSVGFGGGQFTQNDEVWLVDGVDSPLILRKSTFGTYRVVSSCYLWAALELDFWNSGTRKGKWHEQSRPRPSEQTQVIGIF